jgi:uncharacterized protein YcbX
MVSVAWLSVAPVKGLALVERDEVRLEPFGVAENRRFHLVDESGRLMNQKVLGPLVAARASWDEDAGVLAIELPDGRVVEDEVELGEPIETNFYGRPVAGRLVHGPWSAALSELGGRELRLVRPDDVGTGVDRGTGAVTLLSHESIHELARHAGKSDLDPRRFRMLIGLEGCARANEEDEWVGREVQIGEAVVRPLGHVGRCAVTTQNPDTGVPTVDTLGALASYRPSDTTEPLALGVYGEVVRPGRIRLGDAVAPI